MSEQIAFLVWFAVGLIGAWRLNRNDPIDGVPSWLMGGVLGPATLALGIWEWRATKQPKRGE
ncbi:hypothetical protein TomTYG75_06690 [Sphingobium sp. TomTYG75]